MKPNDAPQPSEQPHLSSRFRHAEYRLLFGRARLYAHHVVCSGWRWKGHYQRTIPLSEIERVRWWSGDTVAINMTLQLRDGTTFPFWVASPGLWKFKLRELGGVHLRVTEGLPEPLPAASAA